MSKRRLQGLRVAVLAVDGFEQVEVTALGAKRLTTGLLGGAAVVVAGSRIFAGMLRGRNARRTGLRPDAFTRRAAV